MSEADQPAALPDTDANVNTRESAFQGAEAETVGEAAIDARDESHDSIDPQTGAPTAAALARRATLIESASEAMGRAVGWAEAHAFHFGRHEAEDTPIAAVHEPVTDPAGNPVDEAEEPTAATHDDGEPAKPLFGA